MTTSASSHDSPSPHDSPSSEPYGDDPARFHRPIRISDPGVLISAVPALLGFRPERSLVAISLTGTQIGAVMRHDLLLAPVGPGADVMDRVLEQFATVAAREGADRMLLVMVDDRLPNEVHRGDLDRHTEIAAAFGAVLARRGVELGAVHVCSRIETGAPWQDLGGERRGVLPDPGASAVAVAQVIGGRVIRGSRDELEAVLEPADPSRRAHIAALIDAAREDRVRAVAPVRVGGPERDSRLLLEGVLTAIARADSGEEVCEQDLVETALALERPAVRDSLMALAAGPQAGAAEQFWIRSARSLPDPERAEPLALLGYSSYLRGDGPMAGIALDAALAADPGHRLALLLDGALQTGVRPDVLLELAVVGHGVAADLGVRLPPPDPLPLGGV